MRRNTILLTVCIAVACLTYFIRTGPVRASPADFKEYTITRAETSESRSPFPIHRNTFEARRADGSTVHGEFTGGSAQPGGRRQVWLVPDRLRATVGDDLRIKTTLYYPTDPPARQLEAFDPQCGVSRLAAAVKPSFAGEAEVLGIKTVMIKTEVRSEAGESYRSTEWRAPDLDCVVLTVMEERLDDSGKVTSKFEIQPLTVTVGAPDSRLFEIPLDYAEVTPSQASEANRTKGGGTARPVPGKMTQRLEQEDRNYFANHQAAGRK